MSVPYLQIGLILSLATILSAFAKQARLPSILAYIVTGILVGMSGYFEASNFRPILDFLAQLGITFLLFLVGLELRFSDIKYIGRAALLTGLGQIIFTGLAGFILSRVLGFGGIEAVYIAAALTFSSTIIVVKLLTEKRDLDSLYGKITVGFLLVQDFIAILALIFIASLGKDVNFVKFSITFIEGVVLVGLIIFLNRNLLQSLFDRLAKSTELLFLGSISWALLFASATAALGFSIEIGAFLAGIGLANLREEHQIATRIRPLRDLFIVIFFIVLGLETGLSNLNGIIGSTIVLSLFVLVGKTIIVMIIMGVLGFRARTSFLASVTVAQISEFSLVLVALGSRLEHINSQIVSLITAVGLVTIGVSSFSIMNSSRLYRFLAKPLRIFQRKHLIGEAIDVGQDLQDHVVLIGAGRLGWEVAMELYKKGENLLVVDFDPSTTRALSEKGIEVIFGDVSDPEIAESACLGKSKLVVSTMFDSEDTKELFEILKDLHKKPPLVVTSPTESAALEYYKMGAAYVIIPRVLGSHHISHLLTSGKLQDLLEGDLRKNHIEELKTRLGERQI